MARLQAVPAPPVEGLDRVKPSEIRILVRIARQCDPSADAARLAQAVTLCMSSGYAWCRRDAEGRIRAVLLAVTAPRFYHGGQQAQVVLWWSMRRPWGLTVLRHFTAWRRGRFGLKEAHFYPVGWSRVCDDPRMLRVLQRYGFNAGPRAGLHLGG